MTDDIDFTQALESYLDQHDYNLPEVGDIRKGVIVNISDDGIIVDLGVKRDGFVPPADIAKLSEKERASLAVDQEVPVYIVGINNSENLSVSIHRAMLDKDWIKAQELVESGEITEGEIVGYNRGGALVDFGSLRGFIPLSQLGDFRPGMKDREKQRLLSKLRGEMLPLKVVEVDRHRRRLVLSHRDAQQEWLTAQRAERFKVLEAGQTLHGRVSSLRDFGAFVDIGDGIEGLVHVSELAWYRIDHPREVTKVGEEMDVYVLSVDADKQRISLSRKHLLADPWTQINEKYQIGQLVEGTITRLVNYGVFVALEPGIEGLLHTSKLARNDVTDPAEVVSVGERHLLRVISIDPERQRIGLSLKAVTQQEQIEWMMRQPTAPAVAPQAKVTEATEAEVNTELEDAETTASAEPTVEIAPEVEVEPEAEADVAEVLAEESAEVVVAEDPITEEVLPEVATETEEEEVVVAQEEVAEIAEEAEDVAAESTEETEEDKDTANVSDN
jgi:small subunit ribosomal protein S1